MNIKAQVDFELDYFETTIQHFNHYAKEINIICLTKIII